MMTVVFSNISKMGKEHVHMQRPVEPVYERNSRKRGRGGLNERDHHQKELVRHL